MNHTRTLIQSICCMAFAMFAVKGNAQVAVVQNAIDKLDSYKNFSYQYVAKTLDASPDTTIMFNKDLLQKAPADDRYGYLFSLESQDMQTNNRFTYLYNGRKLIDIFPADTSYTVEAIFRKSLFMQTLPQRLQYWKNAVAAKPSALKADTLIDGAACTHLFINFHDTVINREHYFTHFHIYFSKQTGLPVMSQIKGRLSYTGTSIINYYNELRYTDYRFNRPVNIAAMDVPGGYHAHTEKTIEPVLTPGTPAPDWTLTTTEGKKLTLSQLKGKVVLMDFFFIGCAPCLQSLKPLDTIYEKYKGRDFVLVSISDRDNNKALAAYRKKQNIKNDVCGDGLEVSKAYHQSGAPLFYFIDKDGKVNNVVEGYGDDFGTNSIKVIGSLLAKQP